MLVKLKNNISVEADTHLCVGTLIKFKYSTKHSEEERHSYSKIYRVVIKINQNNVVKLHYITENGKCILEEQILSIEKKAAK